MIRNFNMNTWVEKTLSMSKDVLLKNTNTSFIYDSINPVCQYTERGVNRKFEDNALDFFYNPLREYCFFFFAFAPR